MTKMKRMKIWNFTGWSLHYMVFIFSKNEGFGIYFRDSICENVKSVSFSIKLFKATYLLKAEIKLC